MGEGVGDQTRDHTDKQQATNRPFVDVMFSLLLCANGAPAITITKAPKPEGKKQFILGFPMSSSISLDRYFRRNGEKKEQGETL